MWLPRSVSLCAQKTVGPYFVLTVTAERLLPRPVRMQQFRLVVHAAHMADAGEMRLTTESDPNGPKQV